MHMATVRCEVRERRRTEMADERRGRPWGRREIWREKNMEKKRQRALMRKQPYRLVEPPCTAVVRFAMRYEIRRTTSAVRESP